MWALGIVLLELITGNRCTTPVVEYALVPELTKSLPALCSDTLLPKLAMLTLCPPTDRATSAGMHALLGEDFSFLEGRNGENCYAMVVLTKDDDPPTSFDLVYVISAPLQDATWASKLSDKASHSVIVALNSLTKTGFMLEYTSSNKVFCTMGRLVRRVKESLTRKPYIAFHGFSTFCKLPTAMSFDRLRGFNISFELYSNYNAKAHNCHSYHRSLIASAFEGRMIYNYRIESVVSNIVSSHTWIPLPVGIKRNVLQLDSKKAVSKECFAIKARRHKDTKKGDITRY